MAGIATVPVSYQGMSACICSGLLQNLPWEPRSRESSSLQGGSLSSGSRAPCGLLSLALFLSGPSVSLPSELPCIYPAAVLSRSCRLWSWKQVTEGSSSLTTGCSLQILLQEAEDKLHGINLTNDGNSGKYSGPVRLSHVVILVCID